MRSQLESSLASAVYARVLPPSKEAVKEWRKLYGKDSAPPPSFIVLGAGFLLAVLISGIPIGIALAWIADAQGYADFPFLTSLGIGKKG